MTETVLTTHLPDSGASGARSAADYRAVVAFLSEPSSNPHRSAKVELIETHMSLVFLAGDRVFKMKKPMRLSFVDFSSLEARRINCDREVALNQRLAPGVYHRTLALVRLADGRPGLGAVDVCAYRLIERG